MTEHPSAEGAQPEALRLAHALDGGKLIDDSRDWADTLHAAAAELRRLHARVQELEKAPTFTASQPVAYALFAENGNIRIWSQQPLEISGVVPLYVHSPFASVTQPKPPGDATPVATETGVLREALTEARNWFEQQARAVSKACGSSYELHDLRVQRDALDAALASAAQPEREPHPPHRDCGCAECAPSFEPDDPDAPKAAPARWYMVNADGVATLCADKQNAEQEAADAQAAWPHAGPHRAVQLEEIDDDISRAQYRRMFDSACDELEEINMALGIGPYCQGTAATLEIIEELRRRAAKEGGTP